MDTTDPRPFRAPSRKKALGAAATTAPLTYAFNAADGKGFVIISGDDCTETVLGYCENTTFDADNLPCAMIGWLMGTEEEIAYAREHQVHSAPANYYNPAISPIVKSKWNQTAPYNNLCPAVGDKRCPTGCLATALAQVMYYHKWPQEEIGSVRGYTTDTHGIKMPELPPITFDWGNMRNTYSNYSNSGQAVAELMLYAGQVLKMDYTPSASGANNYNLADRLVRYFNYNPTARLEYREWYDMEEWDEMVYCELQHSRPILYCGYTPNWEGHAFVCDGYDGKGLYHINWGWGGAYDGYFRLSVLNPGTTTQTGAASTDDGFSVYQSIMVGVQPDGPDTSYQLWRVGDFEYNGTVIFYSVIPHHSGNVSYSLLNLNADGTMTEVVESVSVWANYNDKYHPCFDISSLAPGSYTLVPAVKEADEDWCRIGTRSLFAEVEVGEDGAIDVMMHPKKEVEVTNISAYRKNALDTKLTCSIEVTNRAEIFTDRLYVFQQVNGFNYRKGEFDTELLPGEVAVYEIEMDLDNVENPKIVVATDATGRNVIGEHTFASYGLEVVSSEMQWDPSQLTIYLKNNADVDYDADITVTVYKSGVKKALGSKSFPAFIPANEVGAFIPALNFDKSVRYYVTLQCQTTEIAGLTSTMPDKIYVDYATDGIETVWTDGAELPAYNTLGQRVHTGYKGVTIQNGRKYVNK